ncbi:hypothetical protein D3C78_1713880 [compost metagenome]
MIAQIGIGRGNIIIVEKGFNKIKLNNTALIAPEAPKLLYHISFLCFITEGMSLNIKPKK